MPHSSKVIVSLDLLITLLLVLNSILCLLKKIFAVFIYSIAFSVKIDMKAYNIDAM